MIFMMDCRNGYICIKKSWPGRVSLISNRPGPEIH